jgi:hypothetical protein
MLVVPRSSVRLEWSRADAVQHLFWLMRGMADWMLACVGISIRFPNPDSGQAEKGAGLLEHVQHIISSSFAERTVSADSGRARGCSSARVDMQTKR